jgi:hypothetical protein
MTILELTRQALANSPTRTIRYHLGSVSRSLKGPHYAVSDGRRDIMQTTKDATDQLARSGVIKAGSYRQDEDCYEFYQLQ